MAITVPAVGETATAAWADSVANQLNTPTLINTISTATTATSTGTTEALNSGLLLAVTGIVSGQNYWVEFSGSLSSSVAGDIDLVSVHALQGTVLVGSPIVATARTYLPGVTGIEGSTRNLWTPGASGAWNLQVGVKRAAGTGNASYGPGVTLNARLSLVLA